MSSVIRGELCKMLGIKLPIIVSPMFLVTNEAMVRAAVNAGATAALPAHNFRNMDDFRSTLERLKRDLNGPFGVNLITNKSNIYFKDQFEICLDVGVDFLITALGSPKPVMEKARARGIKVFCDVATVEHAQKVLPYEPDALIVLNDKGGGHLGYEPLEVIIPKMKALSHIPIISAGGIGTGEQIMDVLKLGACGVSMGSIFIATEESPVSEEYKQACVVYGAADIVVTKKISGVPLTIINTPYAQELGTQESRLERFLNSNKKLKKWLMTFKWLRSMKSLERAAFGASYKTLWCAGSSIEYTHGIVTVGAVLRRLDREMKEI